MRHLKLLLRTLFSNNACVEAARTKEPQYHLFAILLAIFAVFFAVLPTPIKAFQVNGSAFMSSTYKYNLDTAIYNFSQEMMKNDTKFTVATVDGRKQLTVNNFDENYKATTYGDHKGYLNDLHRYECHDDYNISLEVYVPTGDYADKELGTFVAYLLNNINPMLKLANKDLPDESCYLDYTVSSDKGVVTKVNRSTSFIVFGKYRVYAYSYQPNNANAIGGIAGDYNHIENNEDIIRQYFVAQTETVNGVEKTYENWKKFFDNSYIDIRFANAWRTTGIMIGVDIGVLIFMGLMVFILTRGKNNPFRIYSFWDSQKIAYYSSFTPGLLALGLGFLISNMAMMFFILMLGVRVMWLSMRTLRYTGAAKS